MSIKDKIENAKPLHFEDWNNGYSEGYQQGREDAIDECIKLFKEIQPRLATNVMEFGDMLESLKEQKNEDN